MSAHPNRIGSIVARRLPFSRDDQPSAERRRGVVFSRRGWQRLLAAVPANTSHRCGSASRDSAPSQLSEPRHHTVHRTAAAQRAAASHRRGSASRDIAPLTGQQGCRPDDGSRCLSSLPEDVPEGYDAKFVHKICRKYGVHDVSRIQFAAEEDHGYATPMRSPCWAGQLSAWEISE